MSSVCEQAMPYSGKTLHERRGVKTRLIGVVIIILGVLDTLLTSRGGLPSDGYMIAIGIGAAIFAIGEVRTRRDRLREINHDT